MSSEMTSEERQRSLSCTYIIVESIVFDSEINSEVNSKVMFQNNLIIWEIKIKATMRYHLTFGENTEKLEPLYTHSLLVRMWNGTIKKTVWQFLKNLKVEFPMIQQFQFQVEIQYNWKQNPEETFLYSNSYQGIDKYWNVEETQASKEGWINKMSWYDSRILASPKNEGNSETC